MGIVPFGSKVWLARMARWSEQRLAAWVERVGREACCRNLHVQWSTGEDRGGCTCGFASFIRLRAERGYRAPERIVRIVEKPSDQPVDGADGKVAP